MQALPKLRRRDADTTSYVADYLTRSVRRASGFVLVGNAEVNPRLRFVNTIRIRLGHESLDVTLAYLKGKDAESEEAQEQASSSSLALYA
jgi:hypothetical protein